MKIRALSYVAWIVAAGVGPLAACDFAPANIPPPNVVIGGACGADADCASGVCSAGACVECRSAASCGDGKSCESGRCVAVIDPSGPRVAVPADGLRSTNGARVHVGRVAVVPVSSAEVLR